MSGPAKMPRNIAALVAAVKSGAWADMSAAEHAVFGVYVARANGDTGECWPGTASISRDAGITPRAVKKGNVALQKRGFISRIAPGDGKTAARTYLQIPVNPQTPVNPGSLDQCSPVHPPSEPPFTTPVNPGSPKLFIELSKELSSELITDAVHPSAKQNSSSASVMVFPVKGKAKEWTLTQAMIDDARATYPALDITTEARKALQWIKCNSHKIKTSAGMPRFLNGWFNRAANPKDQHGSKQSKRDREFPEQLDISAIVVGGE